MSKDDQTRIIAKKKPISNVFPWLFLYIIKIKNRYGGEVPGEKGKGEEESGRQGEATVKEKKERKNTEDKERESGQEQGEKPL